jgi:hypothetical protein
MRWLHFFKNAASTWRIDPFSEPQAAQCDLRVPGAASGVQEDTEQASDPHDFSPPFLLGGRSVAGRHLGVQRVRCIRAVNTAMTSA